MPKLDPINEEAGLGPNWVPVDAPPIIPGQMIAAPPASDMAATNPKYFQGSIAPNFQHDTSFVDTADRSHHVPKFDLMPLALQSAVSSTQIQGTAEVVRISSGSGILLQTDGITNPKQDELNLIPGENIRLSSDPNGGVTIAGTAGGDALTHGDPVWEHDSAYVELRDDFHAIFNGNVTSPTANFWGQLGWTLTNTGAISGPKIDGGNPPYIGQLSFGNTSIVSQYSGLVLGSATAGISVLNPNSWALLENPGWKMTWVFKVDGGGTSSPGFNTAKKAFYIGLTGAAWRAFQTASTSARPDYFIGLRYDTSATPGSLTLSSVATASGGTTVYTGTITGGNNGAYIGITFVVSGFTNGVNNGTFVCVNSSTTTLTLSNASGAAETHAATAAGPSGLSDTFFTFEAVQNPQYQTGARHNLQGQTHVTNVTPVAGVWHRLDITCSQTGKVTLTLDGSLTNTVTFTIPQVTVTSTASGQVSANNGIGRIAPITATSGTSNQAPFSAGSVVAVSGLTAGNVALNGTWTLFTTDGGTTYLFDAAISNISNNSTAFTMQGYASYAPFFTFGNDDTATPSGDTMRIFVDYFSFVWNPNLGSSAPGTPDSTKPRYW